jgi:nucleoside-diphosphate-sugar epimerase
VGNRVLHRLDEPGNIALGRSSSLDLDRDQTLPVTLPDSYSLLYTVPPSPEYADDVRLQALLNMLQQPPQRFVYISTTGVYGDHKGAAVDESSGPYASTARAKRRLSAESILIPWAHAHGVALSILRTPGIYGPTRLGIERLRERAPMIREGDSHPGNRIHVDDLVSCCIAALRGAAPAGIYNVGDGDHRSSTAFAKEVALQAGLEPPPEISREEAGSTAAESRLVDTTRMREQLGVVPKYTNAEDGIRASLKETRDS